MATVYGANYTKQFINNPLELIPKGEQYGRVHVAYDSYTASGAIGINDLVYLMKLPAGARVLACTFKHDDLGSTGAISVGTLADPDAFITNTTVTAAGCVQMEDEAGNLASYSSETQIAAKANTATDAAGSFYVMIMYVVD